MTTANAELGAIGQFAAPISDAALLNEVRGPRLYELNFDPDPLDAPSTDATSQAIRKFQQQSNLAPTGTATMGLLQQLRQAGTLQPWGAIVFNQKNGKWGMAWDESTRQAAVARARADLRRQQPLSGRDQFLRPHLRRIRSFQIDGLGDRRAGRYWQGQGRSAHGLRQAWRHLCTGCLGMRRRRGTLDAIGKLWKLTDDPTEISDHDRVSHGGVSYGDAVVRLDI